MNINWLQDFLAVADTRHFTHAANRRNISQAAFSRRIRALESWLGVTLIERGTVPAHLTVEGKRFESEARDTVARLLDARASLAGFKGVSRSTIRVSATHSIAAAQLGNWWDAWSEQLSINLETNISDASDVVAAFLAGDSDLLLCYRSDRIPQLFDPRHFLSHVIETDQLIPVVAANRVDSVKTASNDVLKNMPLLMYSSSEYFSKLVNSIMEQSQSHLLGERVIETQMADFVATCAAREMGMGWIPERLLTSNYNETLVAIDQPTLSATIEVVAYVSRKKRSHACDQIWQSITA